MHYACLNGQLEIAKWLAGQGDQPLDSSSQAGTALHLACSEGHSAVTEWLITQGADVNAIDLDGYRPIHRACHRGHLDIVQMLLKLGGVNRGARTRDGLTPLQVAEQLEQRAVATWLMSSTSG